MFKKGRIAFVVGLVMISGVASADLNSRLVAYWDFDDCEATDASGNGYHGTLHSGSASGIECVDGIRGKALRFNRRDGDNGAGQLGGDYVVIPTLPAMWSLGFTGCAWATFEDSTRFFERIFDFGNGANEDNLILARERTSAQFAGYFVTEAGSAVHIESNSSGSILNNEMHLYCVTVNRVSGLLRLYMDGKPTGRRTTNLFNSVITNTKRTSNFLAHSNFPSNDPDFQGTLDEVRIWSRPLSSAEIQQVYARDSHLEGVQKGTRSYTVTCKNTSTKQTVTLPSQTKEKWDCSAAGLRLGPNDTYSIVIKGKVD